MVDIEYVRLLLNQIFPGEKWTIQKSKGGMSGKTYVAQKQGMKIFIKIDVHDLYLRRLSELHLIPPVIQSGTFQNHTFIIQDYIKGKLPTIEWMNENIPQLVAIVKKYHTDPSLTQQLSHGTIPEAIPHIKAEIMEIEDKLHLLSNRTAEFDVAYKKFVNFSKAITSFPFVPIHADPNIGNFIITPTTVYLIDWDYTMLSSELRDIAPLLWWYIKKDNWKNFFDLYGIKDDDETMKRFYWWVARQSLSVALWFSERGDFKRANDGYIRDFLAAIDEKTNPQLEI